MSYSSRVLSENLTPKRRRLGIRRTRPTPVKTTNSPFVNSTPTHLRLSNISKCESPPLPCNQVEYMSASSSNSSVTSEIPGSPGVFETCFFKDVENWDSFIAPKNKENVLMNCTEEFFSEFESKSEQKFSQNQDYSILTTNSEKLFRDEIEESFNALNQSIANINNDIRNCDKSGLFETKDSFLLDIRESGIVANQVNNKDEIIKFKNNQVNVTPNNFYGLPMIVKGLFKTYRNIEKFYGKFFDLTWGVSW